MKDRRIKKRKKQKDRNKKYLLLIIGIVVLLIVFSGALLFKAIAQNSSEKSNKNQEKKADSIKVEAPKKEEDQKKKAESKDRSGFAVDPNVPVGTTEQSQEKVVYLTLDDGPSPNTIAVLDILDRYNVKATFFVTNAMPEYNNMIKEAYDRGHTIGLHTSSHDYAQVYSSVEAYFSDLDAIGQVVKDQIGYVPCFIRFPGGSSNTVSKKYTAGIMNVLAQEVQARGYQYYDWNCSSGDGSVRTREELIVQGTSCSDNNIVLLSHDSAQKQSTVDALPAIIEHYQSLGYVFKALDRESFVAHHGINN